MASGTASGPARTTYFGSESVDRAVAGMSAGVISTLCMNPLDLVKTRFQVNQSYFSGDIAHRSHFYQRIAQNRLLFYAIGGKPVLDIADTIRGIARDEGVRGLYRGIVPNVIGNASSWGLYFLFYTMAKGQVAQWHRGGTDRPLTAAEHLLCATSSGVVTAVLTNPIWVVKTRMFTSVARAQVFSPGSNGSVSAAGDPSRAGLVGQRAEVYRGLMDGLVRTYRSEGLRGWYRGVGLAIVGVSNGAIQFMTYEKLKQWRMSMILRRRTGQRTVSEGDLHTVTLSNMEYTVLSGAAKLLAISVTYPYQVVRSRLQSLATSHLYRNAWHCAVRTWCDEGPRALYRGFTTNVVRIVPGTCVTFVAYENVARLLRMAAASRAARPTDVVSSH